MTSGLNLSGQIKGAEKTGWFTVLAAESLTTADRTSQVFSHPTSPGVILQVVLANEAGAATITPKLQYIDPDGNYQTFWTGSNLTANGTYTYFLCPGASSGATATEKVELTIPREWVLLLDYTGTPANDKIDTKAYACYL
jgi:hypothetical protein